MTWQQYNPNPTGRVNVGDCAVRAVAKALDTDWETAYAMIAAKGFELGDVISSNAVWGAVLKQNGFLRRAVPNSCPECYDMSDFANDHPKGLFVLGTGNHVATMVDGVLWDSWDSQKEIPLYYWSKEEL